mmetsp:Transcript_75256/g.207623  ORF Transcript_75256/g.207623 Transcript_75256/m.207623 type:complete len:255 (+) Transcript_75256:252-1016(+)
MAKSTSCTGCTGERGPHWQAHGCAPSHPPLARSQRLVAPSVSPGQRGRGLAPAPGERATALLASYAKLDIVLAGEVLAVGRAEHCDHGDEVAVEQPVVHEAELDQLVLPAARLHLEHVSLLRRRHLLPLLCLPHGRVAHKAVLLHLQQPAVPVAHHAREVVERDGAAARVAVDDRRLVPGHSLRPVRARPVRALSPRWHAREFERRRHVALPHLHHNVLDDLLGTRRVVRPNQTKRVKFTQGGDRRASVGDLLA